MTKQKNFGGKKNSPAITVIIAMYNTEEYIGECLESLLAQTFQDFEVIVADDASTDKSVEVVSEFVPRFEGRLKLIRLKKNSGGCGMPRNEAMKIATGKYIAFIDSDDLYKENALEYFYNVAEETGAEVVHAERQISFNETESKEHAFFDDGVTAPTFETDDIGERTEKFIEKKFAWNVLNKLFRRDFLVKHKMIFPAMTVWEDFVFLFIALIRAKKYLRVPGVFYCYRVRAASLSHKPINAVDRTKDIFTAFKAVDEAMSKIDFFDKYPEYRYKFFDWYIQNRLPAICKGFYDFDRLTNFEIDGYCRKNLFSVNPKENTSTVSYFFTKAIENKIIVEQKNSEIKKLTERLEELKKISNEIKNFRY